MTIRIALPNGNVEFDTLEDALGFYRGIYKGAAPKSTSPNGNGVKLALRPLNNNGPVNLLEAIQVVIGNQEVSVADVKSGLKSHGWLPKSKDLISYLRYTLKTNKEIFISRKLKEGKRVLYHLSKTNPYCKPVDRPIRASTRRRLRKASPTIIAGPVKAHKSKVRVKVKTAQA